jgi:hypothetical protein
VLLGLGWVSALSTFFVFLKKKKKKRMHGQNWPPKQNMNFLKLKNKKLQKRRKRRKKERKKGTKDRRQERKKRIKVFFFFFFERKRIKVAVIQIVINLQHTEFRGWPKKNCK